MWVYYTKKDKKNTLGINLGHNFFLIGSGFTFQVILNPTY